MRLAAAFFVWMGALFVPPALMLWVAGVHLSGHKMQSVIPCTMFGWFFLWVFAGNVLSDRDARICAAETAAATAQSDERGVDE